MRLYYEWGIKQLHKHHEELCGDSIGVSRRTDSVMLALSDGLGSGVKANILATLTTRIAMHMLENDLPLREVVQTLTETLPVCDIRKLAYSTFAIAQFFALGYARIVEFDAPSTMHLKERKVQPISYWERTIENKKIHEAALNLAPGDWIIFVSDGVINAGIGGAYPLGWGWEEVAHFVERHAHPAYSAQELADKLAEAVGDLYRGAPGDDVSIVTIKVRKKLVASVLTGPPSDKKKDEMVVTEFSKRPGKLIVCGGSTAKLVAHCTGRSLNVDLQTITADVPPMGKIEGIDLVTEGILTLTQVRELLRSGAKNMDIQYRTDGAANLMRMLLEVDHIHFFVGQAVNPAHQNPELPHQLEIRFAVVREIADNLRKRGREVTIETV